MQRQLKTLSSAEPDEQDAGSVSDPCVEQSQACAIAGITIDGYRKNEFLCVIATPIRSYESLIFRKLDSIQA